MTIHTCKSQRYPLADEVLSVVLEKYPIALKPRPYQAQAIAHLADLARSGWWLEVGTGKTLCSVLVALYKHILFGSRTLVLMPPILLWQWQGFLSTIPGVTSLIYRGTPARRRKLNLDAGFVLMSIQVFKQDFEYLYNHYQYTPVTLIVDEATSVKNVDSGNHKAVTAFLNHDLVGWDLRQKRRTSDRARKKLQADLAPKAPAEQKAAVVDQVKALMLKLKGVQL